MDATMLGRFSFFALCSVVTASLASAVTLRKCRLTYSNSFRAACLFSMGNGVSHNTVAVSCSHRHTAASLVWP